jgi:hypothetical protein
MVAGATRFAKIIAAFATGRPLTDRVTTGIALLAGVSLSLTVVAIPILAVPTLHHIPQIYVFTAQSTKLGRIVSSIMHIVG